MRTSIVTFGFALALLGCPRPPVELSALTVTPESSTLARGEAVQFVASALFSDGQVKDVTQETLWSVDDAFVGAASLETRGLVQALGVGQSVVRARYGGKTITRAFTVVGAKLEALELDPPHPVVPVGLGVELRVTAVRSDGTKADVTQEAIWSASTPSMASLQGSLLVGHAPGSLTLTASVQGLAVTVPVDVTNAVVEQLDVQPATVVVPVGVTRPLTATALLSDGSSLDVTKQVRWSSSAPGVAFVSELPGEQGLVLGRAAGKARVSAQVLGKTGGSEITVVPTSLRALELSPPTGTIALGTRQQFVATGVFADGTRVDLTAQAQWSSSQPAVFSVQQGLVEALSLGSALLEVRVGEVTASRELRVTSAQLTALQLEPNPAVVARGLTLELVAIGLFSDGSTQVLTRQVTWRSADPSVATVSNALASAGRVYGRATGVTELTATLGAVTARLPLTVSAAQLSMLQVTPTAPRIPRGQARAFTAMGLFTDGTAQDLTMQVTWSSSDPTKLAISSQGGSRGLARALAQGTVEVRAALAGQVGRTPVTVTDAVLTALEVSPQGASLPLGFSTRLVATGRFSDGSTQDLTTQVTWTSAQPQVATVSNAPGTEGEVRALSLGQAELTAQLDTVEGRTTLTVSAATLTNLEVTPSQATVAVGLTRDFTAIATYSDGSSRDVTDQARFGTLDPAVATVSTSALVARVTGQAAGTTRLVATLGARTAEASLTVTPAQLVGLALAPTPVTLARGTQGQLTAQATWSDGSTADVTDQVSFHSSDLAVVTVSNAPGTEGQLTAVGMGATTVRAQLGLVSASVSVTVTAATLSRLEVTPTNPTLPLGAQQRFTATGRYSDGSAQDLTAQVTWSSSAPLVLRLSNAGGAEGEATALAQGTAEVVAQLGAITGRTTATVGAATLARVELSPSQPRLAKDTRLQLRADGVWSDGATQELTASCSWSSADVALASVSNAPGAQGRVTGHAAGTVAISATCQGVTGSVNLQVTSAVLTAIELTPASPSAAAGFTAQLTATGRFSDGSAQPFTDFVSWASADVSRATVSPLGLVSARAQGPVTLTATALGVTGSVVFQVTAAVLESLALAPSPAAVPRGLTQPFVAVGAFSDGTTAPLTEAATWSSSAPAVATVSNAAGTRGLATALSEGVTTISATVSGLQATATLTVSPAQLVSLAVTPVNPTLARGLTQQLAATGTFTDGTTRDLTGQVTWSAGDGAVASVSNADGSRGLARALEVGSTALTATLSGISGSTTLTVTAAALVSIGVTPVSPTLPLGTSLALQATGVYTDSTTQDLTAQATWTSLAPAHATVSNAQGSQGLVHALSVGSATIEASFDGVTGSTVATISPAQLVSLAITPPAPSVPAGLSLALIVTGTYSDGSTADLTTMASWASSAPTIAQVAGGVVSGLRQGTASISVAVGAVSSQVTFTVTAALLSQVQVTPQNVSRPKGVPQQFTATGVFTDGSTADLTTSVTWASSDTTRLAISNAAGSQGLGSTVGVGSVTVSATSGSVTGTTPFTVTAAVLTGLAVSPGGSTVSLGSVRQYTATGTYTDGSTLNVTAQATWTSSNEAVAAVSNAPGSHGLATTLSTGVTTISASLGGFSAGSNLLVIQNALTRMELTPADGSTALGYSRQFIAVGTYADGTTQVLTNQVTWSSSDAAVAFVTNADGSRGLLSTVGVGTVTVSATTQGITGTTSHTVTPAVLVLLSVSPGSLSLAAGTSAQLTAQGYFSDGSQQDLTASVTWMSLQSGVAQVSNAAGSQGLVTGIATGTTQVEAVLGSVRASVTVVVP